MSQTRPGMLSPREVQQLQLSLQSRSIREVALTVCTIRGLAGEVKSILRDLFHDDIMPNLPSSRMPETSFNVMPMPPPDPFSGISAVTTIPSFSTQPYSSMQKSGFLRLMAKRGRRRHRCTHCPRTFTAQSSVWRHIKSHHTGSSSAIREDGPPETRPSLIAGDDPMSPPSAHLVVEIGSPKPVSEFPKQTADMPSLSSNQPDTSVATPKQTSVASDENISSAVSPLTSSQHASSPEEHLSPMPTIADMFSADSVKPEPSDEYTSTQAPLTLDADMDIISPLKGHYNEAAEASHSMSVLFPSPQVASRENEDAVRAAIDAQLMDIPLDGMYSCPDCGWRSKSAMSMKAHMLSHKGILPFSCNMCNYKTNKKHVLTRHYTIHTGEKPHKCPICTFGSLDHVELLKHMTKSHPGVHPFTCTICGHHTTTNTLLKKHMKLEHSMSTRRQQSPSSSRAQSIEAHSSSTSSPGLAKNMKPRNVLSSSSETIYASATTSLNQPVFP